MNRLAVARAWGWGAVAVVLKGEHREAWYSNTLIVVAIAGGHTWDLTPSTVRTHTHVHEHMGSRYVSLLVSILSSSYTR